MASIIRYCCVVFIIGILQRACTVQAYYHKHEEWSYFGTNGPATWPEHFPLYCDGNSQSPINIVTNNTEASSEGEIQLEGFDYPLPNSLMNLINNGHTVEVVLSGDFYSTGGPLKSMYKAAQFHFHWGSLNSQGSEHALNGHHFPAEMHIVTWDKDNYGSITEAMNHKNGIAVLGVFIDVGKENPTFQHIVDAIHVDEIKYKGKEYKLSSEIAISGLMPSSLMDYFFYDGSFTTPKCNQGVQWIIFNTPIEISQEQLDALRSVYANEDGAPNVPLVNNYRPTQPLNERTVYHAGGLPERGYSPSDGDRI